jgi:hypothetical protein
MLKLMNKCDRRRKKELRDRALGPPGEMAAVAKVRCSGTVHRVALEGRHLRLLDHPDLKRGESPPCRCVQVRDAWYRGHRPGLPHALRKALALRRARGQTRMLERCTPDEVRHLQTQVLSKTCDAVRQAAAAANYFCCLLRVPPPSEQPGVRVTRLVLHPDEVAGASDPARLQALTYELATVRVSRGWYAKVHRRGLAVVRGCLVLATVTEADVRHRRLLRSLGRSAPEPWWVGPFGEDPDLSAGPLVLVMHEGRDTVRARPARVIAAARRPGGPNPSLQFCD